MCVFFFSATLQGLWDLKFPNERLNPCPLAMKAQNPNHWTTREFPGLSLPISGSYIKEKQWGHKIKE